MTFDQEILTHRHLVAKIEQGLSLLYQFHVNIFATSINVSFTSCVKHCEKVVVSIDALLINISGIP